VADDSSTGGGTVVGLEPDYATLHKDGKDDRDLFQLHLTQLVANAVGLAAAANVTTQIQTVDGKDVCRVHVEPSGHPVWAELPGTEKGKPIFFLRTNNSTQAANDELEIERDVQARWRA